MCIPLSLDVPVITRDGREIGTAREILCPCPGDPAPGDGPGDRPSAASAALDLWLRVSAPARSDLYIPFVAIGEAWGGGVRLGVNADELGRAGWQCVPPGVPVPIGAAHAGAA